MSRESLAVRRARLEPLLASARSFASEAAPRGKLAREQLTRSTGLSQEGVGFALERCLEAAPSEAEIEALLHAVPEAPTAHVLLSSNVFVASHRAIAIGLCASVNVRVRASRREPELAQLLLAGAPDSFVLQSELQPEAGDHYWAYGSDQTLSELARGLPTGVVFHGHGSGIGLAIIEGEPDAGELERIVRGLAEDVVLFDQRGCLSPRVLLISGSASVAERISARLAQELTELETRIPRGSLDPDEAARISAFRDTSLYAGALFAAGLGFVGYADGGPFVLPPTGRNLQVQRTSDLFASLAGLAKLVTCVAFSGRARTAETLRARLPGARLCDFGHMQRPPFDGPVDLRAR